MLQEAQKQQDLSLASELYGLNIQRILDKGDPASAIVRAAEAENVQLIMMASHGFTFDQFLLGSVAAKVLHKTEIPVWTGAHVDEFAVQPLMFAMYSVPSIWVLGMTKLYCGLPK